jgi:hypothetical protein
VDKAAKAARVSRAMVRGVMDAQADRALVLLAPPLPGSVVHGLVRVQVTTRSARRRPGWAPPRLPALASAATAPTVATAPTGVTAATAATAVHVLAWGAAPAPAGLALVAAVLAGRALRPALVLPATAARVPVVRVLAVRGLAR